MEALREAYDSVSYDIAGGRASIYFSDHGQFEAFGEAAMERAEEDYYFEGDVIGLLNSAKYGREYVWLKTDILYSVTTVIARVVNA